MSFNTLDLQGLDKAKVVSALRKRVILTKLVANDLQVHDLQLNAANHIVSELANSMHDLLPVQFHYMLNKHGFDDAIAVLLPALKTENLEKYAMYKAYLEQSRFYEFDRALAMFTDIKDKFAAINPALDFTLEQLKAMWKEAETK